LQAWAEAAKATQRHSEGALAAAAMYVVQVTQANALWASEHDSAFVRFAPSLEVGGKSWRPSRYHGSFLLGLCGCMAFLFLPGCAAMPFSLTLETEL
jgi:hypothetical protein